MIGTGLLARRRAADTSLAARLAAASPTDSGAFAQRAHVLLAALGRPATVGDDLLAALAGALASAGVADLWLALTVLGAAYPDPATVQRVRRAAALDGPLAALDDDCLGDLLVGNARRNAAGRLPRVRVVRDQVLVDVTETSRAPFATGIQRVARNTARRWVERGRPVLLVGWDGTLPALRPLSPAETSCALYGAAEPPPTSPADEVVVPLECTYVLPELQLEQAITPALHALLRWSGNRSGAVGFDCVPLSTAETVQSPEVSNGFALNLAALARAEVVAPISGAAATEYAGWRRMLAGAGVPGPEVRPVALPAEAADSSPADLARARRTFTVAGLPMVLVVGSHEPRKNHAAVLQAAELVWAAGERFSLLFLGGNAWGSEGFVQRVAELAAVGRPVHVVAAVSDDQLWAAYRVARCSVFPSLNEGFGLPLAESLAVGTPAITSGYGSTAEIAAAGGALLVDPRDVADIAAALRRLLADDALHASLAAAARARPRRTWDDYAEELWATVVEA